MWEEVGRGGQKMGIWQELGRTPEYVELYDQKRNYKTRLGAGRAWLGQGRDTTQFSPSPEGNWEPPGTGVAGKEMAKPADQPVAAIPQKPAEKPQVPDAATDWVSVRLDRIYAAYRGNQAAADLKYLNKRVQFEFRPVGIDKEQSGYCAWANLLRFPDSALYGQHYKCHFGADKAASLARFKQGQIVAIRGICAGKTGTVRTSNGFRGKYGGWSSDPVIEFKDCELTENLVDNRQNPLKVTAVALTDAYARNQEAADLLYQDKWMLVDGIVERVLEHQPGVPNAVYLKAQQGSFLHGAFRTDLIGPGKLSVTVGEHIQLKGMCDGKDSYEHQVIRLIQCEPIMPAPEAGTKSHSPAAKAVVDEKPLNLAEVVAQEIGRRNKETVPLPLLVSAALRRFR
jgi:hypothetical protein